MLEDNLKKAVAKCEEHGNSHDVEEPETVR